MADLSHLSLEQTIRSFVIALDCSGLVTLCLCAILPLLLLPLPRSETLYDVLRNRGDASVCSVHYIILTWRRIAWSNDVYDLASCLNCGYLCRVERSG